MRMSREQYVLLGPAGLMQHCEKIEAENDRLTAYAVNTEAALREIAKGDRMANSKSMATLAYRQVVELARSALEHKPSENTPNDHIDVHSVSVAEAWAQFRIDMQQFATPPLVLGDAQSYKIDGPKFHAAVERMSAAVRASEVHSQSNATMPMEPTQTMIDVLANTKNPAVAYRTLRSLVSAGNELHVACSSPEEKR